MTDSWQPITTAPKIVRAAHRKVDLWVPHPLNGGPGSRVAECWWEVTGVADEPMLRHVDVAPDTPLPCWVSHAHTDQVKELVAIEGATHWRWAPPPP